MINSNRYTKAALAALAIGIFAASASNAMADDTKDTKWEKHHPRREEVNKRLKTQDKRINKEVKKGEITKGQAKTLHQEDHQVRQEERDMASQNGSHITKTEKKALNQQENTVSKEIGK